jgi:hypothetical protein
MVAGILRAWLQREAARRRQRCRHVAGISWSRPRRGGWGKGRDRALCVRATKPYLPTPTDACARLWAFVDSCAEPRHQIERHELRGARRNILAHARFRAGSSEPTKEHAMIRLTVVAVMCAIGTASLATPQANAQSPDPALLAPGEVGTDDGAATIYRVATGLRVRGASRRV